MRQARIVLAGLLSAAASLPGATGYRVLARYPVPGAGGFDYVTLDTPARGFTFRTPPR